MVPRDTLAYRDFSSYLKSIECCQPVRFLRGPKALVQAGHSSSSEPHDVYRGPAFSSLRLFLCFFSAPVAMASVYGCGACGADLNLSAWHMFPPEAYFEAGNKGSLSFSMVDESRLRFSKEDKIWPFFETVNYWGIHRKRIRMLCDACGHLVGYIYDDGPPMMEGTGQLRMGPSQAIPRRPRYRFKTKALTITS